MRRAIIVLLPLILMILTGAAVAQEKGATAPGKTAKPAETTGAAVSAPVGHRQPAEKNLPDAVRHDENTGDARDPLGPLPKICRGC